MQAGEAARAFNRTGPPQETCTWRRWGQHAPPGPLGDRPIGWTRGPTSIQSSGPPRPVRAHREIRSGRRPRRPKLKHHTTFTVVRNVRPSVSPSISAAADEGAAAASYARFLRRRRSLTHRRRQRVCVVYLHASLLVRAHPDARLITSNVFFFTASVL